MCSNKEYFNISCKADLTMSSNQVKKPEAEEEPLKEDDDDEVGLPTPPDGGWGWMVVFGSFMIHVIADGVAYSFGIFLNSFIDHFGGGRGETGWIGSLMIGVTWGSGPIASSLTNKFGCQAVTIAGSIVTAFGFIISIFAPNIWFMYFSLGIVSGLGLGLIYLPAIVSVTFYFEKKRAFATGLAVCGSGIGTFIFAPLSRFLLDTYGWRGALLIESGLVLNCIIFGVLFRPVQGAKRKKKIEPKEMNVVNGTLPTIEIDEAEDSVANGSIAQNGGLQSSSVHSLPHHVVSNEATKGVPATRGFASNTSLHHRIAASKKTGSHRDLGPMARKDIFYSGSLGNIPLYRSHPALYTQSITSIPEQLNASNESSTKRKCLSLREMKQTFNQMTDLSLFKDPIFILFALSNFLTSIGFCVPYIYLPDRATQLGIKEADAAFLISIIGISNTVGRVVFGWMSDLKCVNRLMLYNTVLTLCGICTALSIFALVYPLLIIYSASFGLFLGVYVSLTSVVTVDLLGLDKLTNAFGLLLFFQGIAGIIGPPIAGWIYDATGDYNLSFLLMGVMIALSGIMLYSIPFVNRCLRKNPAQEAHDSDMGKHTNNIQHAHPHVDESC